MAIIVDKIGFADRAFTEVMVGPNANRVAPLPALWKLVSQKPAMAVGLTNRGRIAPDLRADLVLIDWPEGHSPAPLRTGVAGHGGYSALPAVCQTAAIQQGQSAQATYNLSAPRSAMALADCAPSGGRHTTFIQT